MGFIEKDAPVEFKNIHLEIQDSTTSATKEKPSDSDEVKADRQKLIELKNGGVILLGPAPFMPASRHDLQQLDVWESCCSQLWPSAVGYPTTRQLMVAALEKEIGLDFNVESRSSTLEYVHRHDGDTDIYFIRNR